MEPVELHTERLVLNQPTAADIDVCTEFCQDPLFESVMVGPPWPFVRSDAEEFLLEVVPAGWASGDEVTWVLRDASDPEQRLLGVVGMRRQRRDIGYWLGAPYRGLGYMPEAVSAILDWNHTSGYAAEPVHWSCVIGNTASAHVAQKCGFAFTGVGLTVARGGGTQPGWTAVYGSDEPGLPWSEVLPAASK